MLSKNDPLTGYVLHGDKNMDEMNRPNYKEYAYLYQLPIDKLLERLVFAPILAVSPEKQAYVDALREAIIENENENPIEFSPM